jgi:hypothetical protein
MQIAYFGVDEGGAVLDAGDLEAAVWLFGDGGV